MLQQAMEKFAGKAHFRENRTTTSAAAGSGAVILMITHLPQAGDDETDVAGRFPDLTVMVHRPPASASNAKIRL